MEISSKNNNFIKQLKKEAKSSFLLFLDTPVLIKEALANGLKIKYLLHNPQKINFARPNAGEVIFVSDEVLNYLSDVQTNAGVLGVFEWPKKPYKAPQGNYLVLDHVQDPGNVGTLIRSALGANFKTVFLLDCASATNQKVIRSSAGAIFAVDVIEMSKADFIEQFNLKNLFVASMNGQSIYQTPLPQPLGIALGNEGKGISAQIASVAVGTISVPMQNNLESLNVAVSGSIIMYQIEFGGKNVRT